MLRNVARVLGGVVALFVIVNYSLESEDVDNLMNGDFAIDIISPAVAAALLYVGFANVSPLVLRAVIIAIGVLYVLMGLLAFVTPTLFGLLPDSLTGFDIGLHLVVGLSALVPAFLSAARAEMAPARSDTT